MDWDGRHGSSMEAIVYLDGAVLAAVSVSGPTARITAIGVGALGEVLLAELRDLSKQLGSRGGNA